jgi:hypothetical protein
MASALDQLINISITQQTSAVQQASFAITAVFGTSNRFAASAATSGTTASGSPNLTSIGSLTGCVPGATVAGTDIPTGTYILTVDAANSSAVMSANASGSGAQANITFQDSIRQYTALSAMVTDGFLTTDPEYVKAAELLEQSLSPPSWFVGRNTASVAQVDTITVNTATSAHVYTGDINGEAWTYTATGGDTTSTIATAIAAAIMALSSPVQPVTAVAVSAVVTVTANVPGAPFTDTNPGADTKYTIANSTPNHTITTDIAQAQLQNNSWYGLAICSNLDGDIQQVATFVESQVKLFGAVTSTAAVATSSTTDIASVLKSQSLKRTFLFSSNEPTEGKETAWMGGQLPAVPGSNSWAYKTLDGCTEDVLTAAQQGYLIGTPEAGVAGKNVNIYQAVGGVGITQMGWAIGGQYLDITVGIDWLRAQLQTNIFSALVNSSKIPYTDKGTGVLISAVSAAIQQGVQNGLIDGTSPITITAPLVATVPTNQRAARVAPTISFSCRLAGAYNAVVVSGTVTV